MRFYVVDFLGVYGNLKSLRLCGVFDYLSGHFKDENADEFLLHDRFPTDLPEMQTLAVYDNGRFVYWRYIICFLFVSTKLYSWPLLFFKIDSFHLLSNCKQDLKNF